MSNREERMRDIAARIAKDRRETGFVTPEEISKSYQIDTAAVLKSGLGNEKALMDNGEIIRSL